MCGVNGLVGKDLAALQRMNAATHHRGPDYSGVFEDEHVTLGHNLLAIREASDLSHQPVREAQSPWVLLFNGQLYNTSDMRRELGPGAAQIDLDTTLLFRLIQKHGWGFHRHIQGMFAIALYNRSEKVLRLYRDPTGQKNIYYYAKGHQFVFSSEIKGILAVGSIDRTVSETGLSQALALGYCPTEDTLFHHIKKLRAGECLTWNVAAKALQHEMITYLSRAFDDSDSPSDVMTRLVREHLQSKQAVSVNLSGGLDSSLLVHEMRAVEHAIHSYTTVFADCPDVYNEDAKLARRLSQDYQTEHTEISIDRKSYASVLEESYVAIEEPNYNISVPVYYLTAKREGAYGDKNRVILSGDGGDEIFGGYPYYLQVARLGRYNRLLTPWLHSWIRNRRNGTTLQFGEPFDRWYFFKKQRPSTTLRSLPVAFEQQLRHMGRDYVAAYGEKSSSTYQGMLMDRLIWMAGENFIRSDKLYMTQSLEMRSPLAYQPLRHYFDRRLKDNDYLTAASNKVFLRNLYSGKLPDYIVHRPNKTGWRSPIAEWWNQDFKRQYAAIFEKAELRQSYVDWRAVRKMTEAADLWPGKNIQNLLSIAILSNHYQLDI